MHSVSPSFRRSSSAIRSSMRLLHAVEIRHESWLSDEALRLLERRSIALVAADTASRHPLSLVRTSRELAYVRLHGARRLYEGRYTEEELLEWARRCRTWAHEGALVVVYFDNDRKVRAPFDALALAQRLDIDWKDRHGG